MKRKDSDSEVTTSCHFANVCKLLKNTLFVHVQSLQSLIPQQLACTRLTLRMRTRIVLRCKQDAALSIVMCFSEKYNSFRMKSTCLMCNNMYKAFHFFSITAKTTKLKHLGGYYLVDEYYEEIYQHNYSPQIFIEKHRIRHSSASKTCQLVCAHLLLLPCPSSQLSNCPRHRRVLKMPKGKGSASKKT